MAASRVFAVLVVACLANAVRPVVAAEAVNGRVRTSNGGIAALVRQAHEQSRTFRSLVATINASDGIVFIEPGRCKHGRRACFVTVTMAGHTRVLWVKLDTRGADQELMGLIGHELQHTVEVLAAPRVNSPIAMYAFYSQQADTQRGGPVFETQAAIQAGESVRAEVRHARAPSTAARRENP